MKVIKYKKRDKHKWQKDEHEDIDTFAWASGFCNGPVCERCYYSFCEHCHPDGYNDDDCQPCDDYECERCGETVRKGDSFCNNCGSDLTKNVIIEEGE